MFDEEQVRSYIKGFAFGPLFNELGWDNFGFQLELPLGISNARQYDVDGATYTLHPVAHKRGFQIFTCSPGAGNTIPPYATRMKIDRSLTKTAREHLIIYLDRELDDMPTTQMWQWVIREHDKPITARDVTYQRNQSATLLLDKLERLNFPLDIEEHLALTDVLERNRQAARADRVTKAFFNKFKEKHDEFQSFIKGIQGFPNDWCAYVSRSRWRASSAPHWRAC